LVLFCKEIGMRIVKVVAVVFAFCVVTARASAEEPPPVQVTRHATTRGISFAVSPVGGPAYRSAFAADAVEVGSSVPAFYLFQTAYHGTIPVAQFIDPTGRLQLVTSRSEIEARRYEAQPEAGPELFVFDQPVEGAAELFRLRNLASNEEFYTVDSSERAALINDGWTAMPSLGWTQPIDSTGVGILKATTLKLEKPELDALASVRDFGRELTFAHTNEVIAALQPGTIIYAEKSEALPLGLVHRVDWVVPTGDGGQIVATSPVELTQAFDEVHLFLAGAPFGFLNEEQRSGDWVAPDCRNGQGRIGACRSMATAAIKDVRTDGVLNASVKKAIKVEWSTRVKNVESRLSLTGSSTFSMKISGQYGDDGKSCAVNPVAVFAVTPQQEFKLSVEAIAGLFKEKEKSLFQERGVVYLSGIPVSADFTLWVGAEATAGFHASATFTMTAGGTAIVRWDAAKKSAKGELCPKTCPSAYGCERCAVDAKFTGEAGFEGDTSIYLRPEVWIYVGAFGNGVGPYVDAKLQLQATSKRYATEIYGQFIPSLGGKLKVGCFEAKVSVMDTSREVHVASIPVAPTNIDASDGTKKGKVAISWREVPNVSGYDIYRSTSAGKPGTKLNSKLLTSATYTDVVNGTTKYWYSVRAVTNKMESPISKADSGYAK
jgi:hypothetical protein